jgi:hypothetical protein
MDAHIPVSPAQDHPQPEQLLASLHALRENLVGAGFERCQDEIFAAVWSQDDDGDDGAVGIMLQLRTKTRRFALAFAIDDHSGRESAVHERYYVFRGSTRDERKSLLRGERVQDLRGTATAR